MHHVPLDAPTSLHPHDDELHRLYESERIVKQLRIENAILNEKLGQLGEELRQSSANVDEMDREHGEAVEKLLQLKGDAQTKCEAMAEELSAVREEHRVVVAQMEVETGISRSLRADLGNKQARVLRLETIIQEREQMMEHFELVGNPNEEEAKQMQEFEEHLDQLQAKVDLLQSELDYTKVVKTDIENRLSEFQQAKQEQDLIRIDLEMQLKDQQSEYEDRLQTAQERYDQKVSSLGAEIDELNDSLQDEGHLETQLQELTNRLEVAEQTIALKSFELDSLQTQLVALEADGAQMKLQLNSAQPSAELEQLKSVASECESKLIHENIVLQKRLDDLQSTCDSDDPSITLSEFSRLLRHHVLIDPSSGETFERVINYVGETLASIDRTKTDLDELTDKLEQLTAAKQRVEHEKQTTQADLHHYEVEVAELMKNNEILLLELDALKTGKLETITEQDEENIIHLEQQLEDCSNLNQSLEGEYLDMRQRLAEAERKLVDQEGELVEHRRRLDDMKVQLDNAETDKSNLAFELAEMKSQDQSVDVNLKNLQEKVIALNVRNGSLEQQLEAEVARSAKQVDDLKIEIELLSQKVIEKEELITKKSGDINDLLEQLRSAKNRDADQEQQPSYETLKQQLIEAETLLGAKSSELIQIESLQQEHQLHIDQLQQQVTTKKELIAKKSAENEKLLQQLQSYEKQTQIDIDALTQQFNEAQELVAKKSVDIEDLLQQLREVKHQVEETTPEPSHTEDVVVKQLAGEQLQSANQMEETSIPTRVAQEAALTELRNILEATVAEKNQLIVLITAKHQESSAYHDEIQRLNRLLHETANQPPPECVVCPQSNQQLAALRDRDEKFTDQVTFLREKADILTANLMTEQANQTRMVQQREQLVAEKAELQRTLERLRVHLLEVEESHTQESMELQRTVDEVQMKMTNMESDAKKSSTAFTSAR